MNTGSRYGLWVLACLGAIAAPGVSNADTTRARDLGIPFSGETVTGASGFRVAEMPEDAVKALFRQRAD